MVAGVAHALLLQALMALNLALLAALVVLCAWAARAWRDTKRARATVAELRDELESRSESAVVARERDFLLRFAREFPQLTRELHSEVDTRRIPAELGKLLVSAFQPWQAVVLMRRSNVTSDPTRERSLVVAAVARPDADVELGVELPFADGELGFAAETQRIMDRGDFEKLSTRGDLDAGASTQLGTKFDLVAPMVFQGETLGVLAIARPYLCSESSKAVLGLVAHIGAMAVHHSRVYGKMRVSAEVDGLTGLYNKTYVYEALTKKIQECDAKGSKLSILLLDIDNFKHYNDRNGHDAGDRLLCEFAQVFSNNTRRSCTLGRYGGEEFLLILPDLDASSAMKAAENVRRAIASHPFQHAEEQPLGVLSFSGGVASYPQAGAGSRQLIRAADKALYEAKRSGRNRVVLAETQLFEPDEDEDEEARQPFTKELVSHATER